MKQTIITLIIALAALAACTGDHETDNGNNNRRDPLTLSPNLAVTTLQTRTQDARDFFLQGDVIQVYATSFNSTGTDYVTYYSYNKAGNTWTLHDGQQHIYLQDVYDAITGQATHWFEVNFRPGWPDNYHTLVADQSTPGGLHSADMVYGDLALDAPGRTLYAPEPLERDCTKLTIEISPGQGWGSHSMPDYLKTCRPLIYRYGEPVPDVIPYYTPDKPAAGQATYTAILPQADFPSLQNDPVLSLTHPASGKTHTLRLDENISPLRGYEITITADLDISGELRNIHVSIGTWKEIDYDGGGNELVATSHDLERQRLFDWAKSVNNGNYHEDFTLQCNLDLSAHPWQPVGDDTDPSRYYTGTFDGGGYTISGLTPQDDDANFALFRRIGAAGRVQNLTVADTDIKLTAANGAYLAGIAITNSGEISGCRVAGSVSLNTPDGYAGGIAAQNYGRIFGCYSAAHLSSRSAGGIVTANFGTVAACHTGPAQITGTYYAGGITGSNSGILAGCYSLATRVEGPAGQTGAITGFNAGTGTFISCHWQPGAQVPTEAFGYNANNTWDPATQAVSYPFADAAQFYTHPTAPGSLMDHMNTTLNAANIPNWRWQDTSAGTNLPTPYKQ